MPFALIIIGLLLIVSGARGTYPQLKELLMKDFTGQHSFLQWIVAIGAVGLLGYVPQLEKFSRAMLCLVIISIFLAEKGFFNKFSEALSSVASGAGGSSTGTQSGSTAPTTDFEKQVQSFGGTLGAIDTATGSSTIGSFVTGILGTK